MPKKLNSVPDKGEQAELAQIFKGICDVCHEKEAKRGPGGRKHAKLKVLRLHSTGKFMGLVCRRCFKLIEDQPEWIWAKILAFLEAGKADCNRSQVALAGLRFQASQTIWLRSELRKAQKEAAQRPAGDVSEATTDEKIGEVGDPRFADELEELLEGD